MARGAVGVCSGLKSCARRAASVALLSLGALELASCAASGGATGEASADKGAKRALPPKCVEVTPGPSPLRRLTRWEYDNTVFDLIGEDLRLAQSFAPEESALGFDNNAEVLGVTQLLAEQYKGAAEKLATRVKFGRFVDCDPTRGEAGCVASFLHAFAARAYRRPLTSEEHERLLAAYARARQSSDVSSGIRAAISSVLQSPDFLYRIEVGSAPVSGASLGAVSLSSWEIATRLSYLLWGTMPDGQLFDAARHNRLSTREQVRTQAERMLKDERARRAVMRFYEQWLELDELELIFRDDKDFPGFNWKTKHLMRRETEAFLNYVTWDGAGDLKTLLTAPYTFLNQELASFYGVSGPKSDAFERVEMPKGQRAGLLTQGSLMTMHARTKQTSPVHRGKFVRERLLCQLLDPPPEGMQIQAPDLDPKLSTRERFAKHASDPYCSVCHKMMDPIGLGFEHYDPVGRWRENDNGHPVLAKGKVVYADVEGEFSGAVELAERLAGSEQVGRCFVKNWFRFAYGRSETPEDACTLAALYEDFAKSGYDIEKLIVSLTQTDAFLYRTESPP
jgi:hypothetical protein